MHGRHVTVEQWVISTDRSARSIADRKLHTVKVSRCRNIRPVCFRRQVMKQHTDIRHYLCASLRWFKMCGWRVLFWTYQSRISMGQSGSTCSWLDLSELMCCTVEWLYFRSELSKVRSNSGNGIVPTSVFYLFVFPEEKKFCTFRMCASHMERIFVKIIRNDHTQCMDWSKW